MKTMTKMLALLGLISVLAACGKKDDQVVTTQAAAAAPACAAGQVYSPQYGCAPTQYGQPGTYNGGQNWQPVNVTMPTCQSGGYYQYPQGGGYGQYPCQSQYQQPTYRWYFYAGFYYYY